MFSTSTIIDNLNHSEGLEYKKLCNTKSRSLCSWCLYRKK